MIRSRILYKGLAFILLPLALQVVCFFGLYTLTVRLEHLAEEEARLVKTVTWINMAMSQFVEGWTSMGGFMNSAGQKNMITLSDYKQRTVRLFRDGEELFGGDPHLEEVLNDCRQIAEVQYRGLKMIAASRSELQGMLGLFNTMGKLKPDMDKLFDHTRSLEQHLIDERNATMAALEAERATRDQIKTQVMIGISAAVLLTVGIMILFLNNISNRLAMLVSNAKLIPSLQKLEKTVPGSDELAYLDNVMHEASDELRTAAENRKQLMGMVAHDLRNPLVSAKMTLDGVMSRGEVKEPSGDLLESVRIGVGRVLTLLEDLLTIDKLEAGKLQLSMETVEIKPLIADVFETMSGYAKARRVELKDATDPIVIEVDRLRFMQVLDNLISNAIKFSPEGGTVTVSDVLTPSTIKFKIADQGAGISDADRARLFEKFYQTSEGAKRSGHGLGLAISKLIVGAHGGSIGVDNRQPSGSEFWFELPMSVDLTNLDGD
jgi:signal transduction histidine kinase